MYAKLVKKYKKNNTQFKSVEEEIDLPSLEIIYRATEVVLIDFPYEREILVNGVETNQVVDTNVIMITVDFGIQDENSYFNNEDIIDEYYSQNLDYAVLDEIASNPELYSDNVLLSRTYEDEEYTIVCSLFFASGYGWARSAYALWKSGNATDDSVNKYATVSGSFSGVNDRRDAYRHLLWSAYLANYYFAISSKQKRKSFSKYITDLRENTLFCGNYTPASSEMDIHNNTIGREMWDDLTKYRTFLWMTVGLNKPSVDEMKDKAFEKVETQSCLIVSDIDGTNPTRFSINETILEIAKISQNTVVYISGNIASGRYITQNQYDYSNCEEELGGIGLDGGLNENESNLNGGTDAGFGNTNGDIIADCPIFLGSTTTFFPSCFVAKDPNYNPYN